jgi:hypothetical protein
VASIFSGQVAIIRLVGAMRCTSKAMNGPGLAVRWTRKFGGLLENRKNETCDTGVKIEAISG